MKYSKRYIAFTFILALIFVSNFYIYAKDSSTLGAFRGAQIDNTIWSPLVAADVNGTTIRLRIENKEYTSEDEHVYMDENRNIMVPVSMLRDALNSSAHVYNKNELLVEKHSLTADFKLADDNGFVQYKGQFYASLDKLSKLLDMTCSFDTATKRLMDFCEKYHVSLACRLCHYHSCIAKQWHKCECNDNLSYHLK